MTSEHDQGLGVSIAIYMVAMVCGLALFVLPVLLVNWPGKGVNVGMAAYQQPPGTLLIPKPARYSSLLVYLKHDDIVDPALLADMNAKVKELEKPQRLASRTGQRVRSTAPPANLRYAQPVNSNRSFFTFF
jgi:hypothetical protein